MSTARRIVSLYTSPQFFRFVGVGGVAALLHWLSRFAFNSFMSYASAIVLAYIVGIAVAFVLNRIYVFPYSNRPIEGEMFYFVLVNAIAFPFVWAIAYVLGEWVFPRWMPHSYALALGHGIAILVPLFFNFAAHKFVTFRGA